ncbi:hypothetical protein [Corynebacterium pelargi]|uniref:Uncharacterized protein n=1 Tax=Corynebacterium pelargi TaxID=1471400 RepID=A0A410W7I4_9CORY|nr:hypothetical protein [Corynebacterium pelargi]QAU51867.1 hypothetical protein CPELA_02920 [Corynebacterium pelargi]GGG71852.1 hypothetical protein GCM10007338_06150 [Corynebacterium pelargi]
MIQQTIRATERALGDEFHIRKYHEASTYTLTLAMYLTLIGCIAIAVLADNPWLSFIPLATVGIANSIGTSRMRKEIPVPVIPKPFSPAMRKHTVVTLILTFIWLLIFSWKLDGSSSFINGGIIGGIVGVVVVLLIAPVYNRKQHKRDTARIDAELED